MANGSRPDNPQPGSDLVPVGPTGAYLAEPVSAGPPQPPNPLLIAHRALRGRYVVAVVLAVIVGCAGSYAGWIATKPMYESQGWIRAFPRQQRILYETPENTAIPMFDAYVKAQAELAKSRRVIDLALSQPEMRASAWPLPPVGVSALANALSVNSGKGSELISVVVSHPDPQLAQVGANAVLIAFMQYQAEQDSLTVTDRERELRKIQGELSGQLRVTREAMVRLTEQIGGDLEVLISAKTDQLTKLETALFEPAMVAAASMPTAPSDPASSEVPQQPASVDPADLTVEELAKFDEMLATLLSRKSALRIELEGGLSVLGANHREVRAMRQRLTSLETSIDERAAHVRGTIVLQPGATLTATSPMGPDPALIYRQTRAQRDRVAEELRSLLRARPELKGLQERERDIENRLAETNRALDMIRVEDEVIRAGRLRIQQLAATPLNPTKDRRRPLAAAGFMGGAGAVIGLFVLASLLQKRIRYADELESIDRMLPLIGVIPEAKSNDPETASAIALSLHHVRNSLLLIRTPRRKDATMYLVTSAIQGEGKTACTIALGASFAQAGYRVTLVDCDLVGQGMTRELALTESPGLAEALGEADIGAFICDSHVAGMRVLPAGRYDHDQAERLSMEQIEPLLAQVRKVSDIVIVDTGPILGSLEVSLLARLADVVIVIAARGTSSKLVNAALDRARKLRGDNVSLIFNRANREDMSTSASYSSVRSVRDETTTVRKRPRSDRGRLLRIVAAPNGKATASTNGQHIDEP